MAALAEGGVTYKYLPSLASQAGGARKVFSLADVMEQLNVAVSEHKFVDAVRVLEQLPQTSRPVAKSKSEAYSSVPQLFSTVTALSERGFAMEMIKSLTFGYGVQALDSPGFVHFADWPGFAALGFLVSKLSKQHQNLEPVIEQFLRAGPTQSQELACYMFSLVLKASIGEENQEAEQFRQLAESNLLCCRPTLKSDQLLSLSLVAQKAAALSPLYPTQSIQIVKTEPSTKRTSAGMIGVDRLLIEGKVDPNAGTLVPGYQQEVFRFVDRIRKKLIDNGLAVSPYHAACELLREFYLASESFSLGKVILLSQALTRRALDCDASAYIAYDILTSLGFKPSLVVTPGHALIFLDGLWIETAQGSLLPASAFEKKYGGFCYQGQSAEFAAAVSFTQTYLESLNVNSISSEIREALL